TINDINDPPMLYSLTGTILVDTDSDDGFSEGDTAIPSVQLLLLNASGSGEPIGEPIATTITDENGFYRFDNLANGNYVIIQRQPTGLGSVTDIDGTNDNRILVQIDGANVPANDFLEDPLPELHQLSGTVLEDTDNDDAFSAGDTPIAGVTVELFATDADGNQIGEALDTAITDDAGFYEFTGLADGNYVVVETQPEGFDSVREVDDVVDNNITVTIDGADAEDNNFLEQAGRFDLSGAVFKDTDNSGDINGGDEGVEDVTLELYSSDSDGNPVGSPIATTTSNGSGFYQFTDLLNGEYVVVQVQPNDLVSVTDTDGANDNQIAVTIANSDTTGHDFLEDTPVFFTLSGAVFEDADNNGTISGGDNGVAEVTLQLFSSDRDDNPVGEPVQTTTTNLDGFYQFTNLDRGEYVVVQSQPGDLNSISDTDGANDNRILVSISDSDSSGHDFLEEKPEELFNLSGQVFADIANDGDFSDDDTLIPSVELELFNANANGEPVGEAIASTTTDENGFYRFGNLANGNYVIVQNQPPGFASLTDTDGTDDNQILVQIDGGNLAANNFLEVNLIEGTASPDVLMGTAVGETISGYKGQDTLTGGGGSDRFFYTETSDGVDIITDFTSGEDRIDLSQIMSEELGYSGSDPIADGFVVIRNYGSVGSMIQIDFDQSGELLPKDVVFLDGVTDINPNTDLIF
ncbi:MAG: SdrD B-like domain-containing protein, partial [Cyanobacteria bacterium J06582_2]